MAELHANLGKIDEASRELRDCVEACKELTDSWEGLNCLGISLLRLGEIEIVQRDPKVAIEMCRESVRSFQKVLDRYPDEVVAVVNMGNAWATQGRAEVVLHRLDQGVESLENAIAFHRRAVALAEELHLAQLALVTSLHLLARSLSDAKSTKAIDAYSDAISACDMLLRVIPGSAEGSHRKALLDPRQLFICQSNSVNRETLFRLQLV